MATSNPDPLGILGRLVADRYRVERFVSQGGFAAVYRAIHVVWGKPVAIKLFTGLSTAPSDQRDELERAFIREGAFLTDLSSQSAGIVQARDVGTWVTPNGQWLPFMVLEWLEGLPFDEVIERERALGRPPWTLAETYALIAQIAVPLNIAHRQGIAHRDIKPANLFLLGDEARAGGVAVKILDFGVAKIMADKAGLAPALATTGLGIASFTPHYGAPEQFSRSHGATGPWTDVFALSLVAVEALTFRAPLEGDSYAALGLASCDPRSRPTPRARGAEVPDDVERVFEKALAISPADRYANAGDFLEDFGRAMGAPSAASFSSTRALSSEAPRLEAADSGGAARMGSSRGTPAPTAATPLPSTQQTRARVFLGALGAAALLAAFVAVARGHGDVATARPVASASAVPRIPPREPLCSERMAKIPQGQYFRGSDAKDAPDNQKPAHPVALNAYCIDLYEVTAAEYKACSDAGKCKRAAAEVDWPNITPVERKVYSTLCTFGRDGEGEYPINCVTWEMADIYCRRAGKRLPTEAEWEYAARGPDGRTYPWGDEEPTSRHLNACGSECARWARKHRTSIEPLFDEDDGFPTLAPVGRFEVGRSRFGPYDVVGNVWEWVADYYAEYTPGEKTNPTGPAQGERKVIRGGGWNGGYATWLRPAFRYAQAPDATSHGIGFRCAKTLD